MRRVADERDPPERPATYRVAVGHWILEHDLGVPEHLREIQPLEAETLEGRQEVGRAPVQIPVRPNVARREELGSPGDEPAALRVELLADRIDDDLADVEPAALDEALAAEIRRPARHSAPHVDPRIYRRPLVRVELPAHGGMNTVASDRNAAAHRFPAREADRDAALALFYRFAAIPQCDGIGAEPLPHRLDQHPVQLAAVDRKLRPGVARVAAARLLVDELPEAVVEAHLARQDRMALEMLRETELGQLAHCVGEEVDSDPEPFQLRRRFVHVARNTDLVQAERKGQARHPAADDENVPGILRSHLGMLACDVRGFHTTGFSYDKTMRYAFLVLLAALVLTAEFASAQDWPSRPVRMIVPQAAGGTPDIVARVVSGRLSQALARERFPECSAKCSRFAPASTCCTSRTRARRACRTRSPAAPSSPPRGFRRSPRSSSAGSSARWR